MEVTSFNFLYMLEMLFPAIGLCIPLKKRKHGMGKAMAIIIVKKRVYANKLSNTGGKENED